MENKNTRILAEYIKQISLGYIFLYFNINLGTLNIMPDWLGMIFIIRSIPAIAQYEPSAQLLKIPATLLALWEGFEWIAKLFGMNSAYGFLGWGSEIISIIIGVLSIYFHFQLLTNLADIAGTFGLEERRKSLLKARTINTVLQTILALITIAPDLQIATAALVLAVINLIVLVIIFLHIRSFAQEVAHIAEKEKSTGN